MDFLIECTVYCYCCFVAKWIGNMDYCVLFVQVLTPDTIRLLACTATQFITVCMLDFYV